LELDTHAFEDPERSADGGSDQPQPLNIWKERFDAITSEAQPMAQAEESLGEERSEVVSIREM